ncbi:ATP-dependent zinc metalloprotease FtsH [Pseudostreptobacillus hongkongensis]|uniref:ATP-dependent zinc metalloprotease FtsH n=1 Tax=Pseudostreptobacillus hongkongensis TaxID=1162717 RepID=UPI0008377271|nr:ATP-dependent zinc metalloprotease FtsH [Pseudostreptobacillus hongkongensis]
MEEKDKNELQDEEVTEDQNNDQNEPSNNTENEENKKEKDKEKSKKRNEEEEFQEFINKIENLKKNKNKKVIRIKPGMFFMAITIIFLTIYLMFGTKSNFFEERQPITYTQFTNKIRTGEITTVRENQDNIEGIKKREGKIEVFTTNKITSRLGEDTNLMSLITEKGVDVNVNEKPVATAIISWILGFVPLILMIGFFVYMNRSIMGGSASGRSGGIFSIGKSNGKISEKPNVKFSDVAGLKEEKEELKEIVEFLKDPSKFEKAGARVPKGILLLGEPGTGKTLLAKAVAGETGAAFFSMSGSEFVELYVGAGALKVRELFKEAKQETPAIIFIDEIDAVGRRRNQGKVGGGNEEREQTLNQLLVEMDGFETDQRIIVMAATNRADVLDPALLRGGRFDRRIEVSAPDVEGRIAILKVHTRNKKLNNDVKLEDIAKITPGFVGADLENLINEAAILAARRNSDTILMEDLDEAVDKIGMGLGQKSKIISQRDRDMLAYHEGGHALVASMIKDANKVHKVTIIPRGDAGGYMMPLPEETLGRTRNQILAEINVLFAGRAAEELMMDDIATGAYSDIKRATDLARLLITRVGMNTELGPINYENSNEGSFVSEFSDQTSREIDIEVRKLLKSKYEETLQILKDNKEKLQNIADLLKEKETVTGYQIRAVVSGLSVEEVLELSNEELEKYN